MMNSFLNTESFSFAAEIILVNVLNNKECIKVVECKVSKALTETHE